MLLSKENNGCQGRSSQPISCRAEVCYRPAPRCQCLPPHAASPGLMKHRGDCLGKSIETTMLDPHTALVGSAWQLQFLIYETLTTTGDGSPYSRAWRNRGGAKPTKYIFHIREGVAFSNGRPMTSEDVAGSIARVVDPKFGSWWASQMGSVKSVTATNARTVTIELNEPFTPLLASLAASMTAILPMKELKAGTFDPSKEMMGTGRSWSQRTS